MIRGRDPKLRECHGLWTRVASLDECLLVVKWIGMCEIYSSKVGLRKERRESERGEGAFVSAEDIT